MNVELRKKQENNLRQVSPLGVLSTNVENLTLS